MARKRENPEFDAFEELAKKVISTPREKVRKAEAAEKAKKRKDPKNRKPGQLEPE